jgi:S-(hydroxymethyl)glutathione dehydrogenase/alcohol dehydrogenase
VSGFAGHAGMKAAVLRGLDQPLEIVSGLRWAALRRGQVLVKLAYSGVCHSQLMEARGLRGQDAYLPHLLGHEGSGQVIEVGPEVSKVNVSDFVVLGWIKGRGIDGGGTRYHRGDEAFNAGGVTTFNEYAVVSENRLIRLAEGVPLDVAVLFGCAVPTGAGIVLNEIQPAPGSSIAIFGLGGIGLSALMATKLFDFSTVIAIDVAESKLQLALEFGATKAVNSASADPLAEIASLTDGRGVDYSIDASGMATAIEMAFRSVRRSGGLCVFASHPAAGESIRLDPYELICGKQIKGTWGGACDPDRDIPRLMELYLEGKLPLERLITKRYSLDHINEALEDLAHGRVGRPLVEIEPSRACAHE